MPIDPLNVAPPPATRLSKSAHLQSRAKLFIRGANDKRRLINSHFGNRNRLLSWACAGIRQVEQFAMSGERLGRRCQWVLDDTCQVVEWLRQHYGSTPSSSARLLDPNLNNGFDKIASGRWRTNWQYLAPDDYRGF
jgi:hypothetical protein